MLFKIPDLKTEIYEAYPNLPEQAKAYVEGLEKMITIFTNTIEEIIQQQCSKIYLHLELEPNNKKQRLIKQKILDLSKERIDRETSVVFPTEILTEGQSSTNKLEGLIREEQEQLVD
jgi:hypothetical protein